MVEEYSALVRNKTWSLVPLPPNIKAFICKWLFKVKKKNRWQYTKAKGMIDSKGTIVLIIISYEYMYMSRLTSVDKTHNATLTLIDIN